MKTKPPADADVEAELDRATTILRAQRPLRHRQLREARKALDANRPEVAERVLENFIGRHPDDVDALNLLGEAAMRHGRKIEAEALYGRCVERAPGFDLARYNHASALQAVNKPGEALQEIEPLIAKEPRNLLYRELIAVILSAAGHHEEALAARRDLARDYSGSARLRVSYAQSLRTLGRREECIDAFRRAIEISPSLGIAWWGLANLKTFRFTAADISELQAQLATTLSAADRTHLLFALGKALGDAGRYAESFEAYARANAGRRMGSAYDPDTTTAQARKIKALYTPQFFRERAGSGCSSDAPIFVVGMQRSGSTLVEQILASHPAIEGAGELAHLRFLARRLEQKVAPQYHTDYPGVVAHLDEPALKALGEDYLDGTRIRRPLGRRRFVDKDPFNFWHIGLLQLILPNARIVDVRRHPLACCWSNFTTIFLHGLPLAYRLSDIGRFYADYVELMAHYDRVLPGKVHRLFYEDLVADPENEIRRLLDYLSLPFEETCLRFHTNSRAINSASSEQVRTPIFGEALDWWRHYEPWLGPLKAALGPVLDSYPAVPEFAP